MLHGAGVEGQCVFFSIQYKRKQDAGQDFLEGSNFAFSNIRALIEQPAATTPSTTTGKFRKGEKAKAQGKAHGSAWVQGRTELNYTTGLPSPVCVVD